VQVKKLQRQLEEEIELHVALADAVTQNAAPALKSSSKIPHEVQELQVSLFYALPFPSQPIHSLISF
jgi:hypothetical protein